jgi:hypothetical protein
MNHCFSLALVCIKGINFTGGRFDVLIKFFCLKVVGPLYVLFKLYIKKQPYTTHIPVFQVTSFGFVSKPLSDRFSSRGVSEIVYATISFTKRLLMGKKKCADVLAKPELVTWKTSVCVA